MVSVSIDGVSYELHEGMVRHSKGFSVTQTLLIALVLFFLLYFVGLFRLLLTILSLCVALYVIMLNNSFAPYFVSLVLPPVMRRVDAELRNFKTELFKDIRPEHTVIDLGAGATGYLSYCKKAREIVAIEPNARFEPMLKQEAQRVGANVKVLTGTLENYKGEWFQKNARL